jgi:hypothetical protein
MSRGKTAKYSGSILSMDVRSRSFSIQTDDPYIVLNSSVTLYADEALFWDIVAVSAKTHCVYFKFYVQGKVIKHFVSHADEIREVLKGGINYQSRQYQHERLVAYDGKKVLVQPHGKDLMVRDRNGGFICLANSVSFDWEK